MCLWIIKKAKLKHTKSHPERALYTVTQKFIEDTLKGAPGT